KEGRTEGQRMNRRTDVVPETRQGEFSGPSAATNGIAGLEYEDREMFLGQADGRRQAVWPGTDHHGVVRKMGRHTTHRGQIRQATSAARFGAQARKGLPLKLNQ